MSSLTVGLTAGALLLPLTSAHAEPTPDEVREEIEGLEEEFIGLSATYNEAEETHEAAEEKLEEVLDEVEAAQEKVDTLGLDARKLASASYTGPDFTSFTELISSAGPEAALAHQADLTYLSDYHDGNLEQYVEELANLETLEAEATETEEEAAEALKEAEDATEEAEDAIAEQEELLSELTPEEQASATENISNSNSGGGSYTGPASGNARTALNFAYGQIGKPYGWGATGPGSYDCSGLTQAAWGAAGVSLPRTTYSQVNAGQRVSWENKQPGDLLFFYPGNQGPDHVGMYAGDGMMVHASNSRTPIGEVALNDYYRSNFVTAVRP